MNIKRLILFITIMALSLGLLSCSSVRSSMLRERLSELNASNDNKIADTRFQNIIEALEDKDKEGLKKIFSPNALEEAKDIYGSIDYILKFYKGNLISKDDGDGPVALDSKDDGERTSELQCMYEVTTDEDKYIVFFIDQLVDTKNPDNIGLYMLQIIKDSNKEKEFDWGNKTKCAGIYRSSTTESK